MRSRRALTGAPSPDGSSVAPRRRLRVRFGVSTRLLGTIALPLVLLSFLLADIAIAHRDAVRSAKQVASTTDVIKQFVRLRSALFIERLGEEIFVPSRRPPADLLARTKFGSRLVAEPDEMFAETDATLGAIAPADRPFTIAELAHVRKGQPALATPDGMSRSSLAQLDARIVTAATRRIADVRQRSLDLGDERLVQTSTVLQRSFVIPEQAGDLLGSLADLWGSPPGGRLPLQSKVAGAKARYDALAERLTTSITEPTGPVSKLWTATQHPPRVVGDAIDSAIRGELSADTRPGGQPIAVGIGMLDGIDWLIEIDDLPSTAADVTGATARSVADHAQSTQQRTLALILLAIGATVGAAVLFGRSIAAPVRRFSEQAFAVGRGHIDVDPLVLRGPPEITRASAAFNEMVGNLVLLEQKSRALADRDFDHPALSAPLPGMLGASLQRSIEVLSDSIEEREQLQRRLRFEATHDPLTGLANRAALIDVLESMQSDAVARRLTVAVIFIDLNDFKRINDRHGHASGDELLLTVGARMAERSPADATLARLGGDEFVCAMPDVADHESPVDVARRLVQAAAEPVLIDGRWLNVGASAGVALSTPEGRAGTPSANSADGRDDPLELLRKADLAVYSAKDGGRTENVAVYDDELDRQLAHEEDIEVALRDALRPGADELRMVYQPVVDSTTGDVFGFESLVRWERDGHGPIVPDRFIPIAEKTDLVRVLDRWVFRTVLDQLAAWELDPAFDGLHVSVNVSGRSLLDPTFVEYVVDTLDATSVDPSRLAIEVTETAVVTDMDLAAAQLAQIRRLGIRVAIDDFGTGYTSIAHLRAMPVDSIKIDSSFIHRLLEEDNLVFVRMINQLAHQLAIPTVAEGVETLDQVRDLRSVGCDQLQGYLFSAAMEVGAVRSWLCSESARPLVAQYSA